MSQKKKTKAQAKTSQNDVFAAKRQELTEQAQQYERALKQQVKSIVPTLAVLGVSALAYGLLYRYVSRKEILDETTTGSTTENKPAEAVAETKPTMSWSQQLQWMAAKFLTDVAKDFIRELMQGASKREDEDHERS
ncbi:MAG TPA: hypothetical protein DCM08_03630 [Microscillaceae bacterium]|jgi:hypothetical protein|nr:hypothetical protein [Microscillaceae bacterium]